jgi:hypothetical protein
VFPPCLCSLYLGEMLCVVYCGCETDVEMCVRTSCRGDAIKNNEISHTLYDAKIYFGEDMFPKESEVNLISIIALK